MITEATEPSNLVEQEVDETLDNGGESQCENR